MPAGRGLMTTQCKTVRMAARLRSVFHAFHASRSRSEEGMSLSTMPDLCDPVVFAAGLGDVVFGGWRMSSQPARSMTWSSMTWSE